MNDVEKRDEERVRHATCDRTRLPREQSAEPSSLLLSREL